MKKLYTLILVMILMCSLTGCININITMPEKEKEVEVLEEVETAAEESVQEEEPEPVPPSVEEEPESVTLPVEEEPEPMPQPAEEAPQQTPEELEDLYEQWALVVGYWNTGEDRYAVPDMMDSHTACFLHDIWPAKDGEYGLVTSLCSDKEYELTAVVTYENREPAQETVIIDYSGLDQDGKIRMKIGEDEWRQYMFAGNTSDEAFITYYENKYLTGDSGANDPMWPDNEFTRLLVKPNLEIISLDEKETGFYVEFAENVTIEDIITYAKEAQDGGFNVDVEIDARAAGDTPRYNFSAKHKNGYFAEVYWMASGSGMSIRK